MRHLKNSFSNTHPPTCNPCRIHRTWCSPDASFGWQRFCNKRRVLVTRALSIYIINFLIVTIITSIRENCLRLHNSAKLLSCGISSWRAVGINKNISHSLKKVTWKFHEREKIIYLIWMAVLQALVKTNLTTIIYLYDLYMICNEKWKVSTRELWRTCNHIQQWSLFKF